MAFTTLLPVESWRTILLAQAVQSLNCHEMANATVHTMIEVILTGDKTDIEPMLNQLMRDHSA